MMNKIKNVWEKAKSNKYGAILSIYLITMGILLIMYQRMYSNYLSKSLDKQKDAFDDILDTLDDIDKDFVE